MRNRTEDSNLTVYRYVTVCRHRQKMEQAMWHVITEQKQLLPYTT